MIGLVALFILDPGLAAFRTLDRNGQTCASCHSPDGIELHGFTEANIRRRIARHFSDPTALVGFLHRPGTVAVRPYQPTGSFLWLGSAKARDAAFGASLKRRLPKLMGSPISSLAEAEQAAEEVKAIDLFSLPIGIALNRLSSDGFHSAEQATIADWIPDVPIVPDYALQDRYLEKPNLENLKLLEMQSESSFGGAGTLAKLKYQVLSRYQHELRTGERAPIHEDNPFWQIGEFGRSGASLKLNELGFPASVIKESQRTRMSDMRLPWYWLGWMFDPGLQHSGHLGETSRADYFVKTLRDDGPYPAHTLFMLTRKLADQGTSSAAWTSPWPQQYEIQYSFWLLNGQDSQLSPEARALEANSFRMSLHLLQRDIGRFGTVIRPESQRTQVQLMRAELKRLGCPDNRLCDQTLKAIATAQPLR